METCVPYLWKQLGLIKPKIILCLGRVAAQVLLKTNDGLNKLRGKVFDYQGSKVLITYHPAALLRNPGWKRPTWEDMQFFKKILDEVRNADPGSEMKRS
jgi:DNA polymerase